MAYVGMVYNPVPQERARWADPGGPRPAWQARYVAQLRPLAERAEPLRRQAGQVEISRAQRWLALSDGGAGREDFLRQNFPLVYVSSADLYVYFFARTHQILRPGGTACVISSNKWLKAGYGEPLRRFFAESASPSRAASANHRYASVRFCSIPMPRA